MCTMKQRHWFSMVEIVLALGVLAVGVVSILALFPVGFKATQDSLSQSFAADTADHFLHLYAAGLKSSWATYVGSGYLPGTRPPPADPIPPGWTETDAWSEEGAWRMPNVTVERNTSDNGIFRVTNNRGPEVVDFQGIYRIWREDVTYEYLDRSGGWVTRALSSESAVALNLEASWPAALPYANREKHLFRLEVFRYDQP